MVILISYVIFEILSNLSIFFKIGQIWPNFKRYMRYQEYCDHFLPRGVYSGWGIVVSLLVRTSVRPYVRPYVRPSEIFFEIFFFLDRHIGSSWLFFYFLKKMIFCVCHALFLTIFLIFKGLLGARCKSGDLCWKGFVCRFWIYIVVRPDLVFAFFKKAKKKSGRTTIKIQNLHTKPFQHKSPDLQRAPSKPLCIRKMVKKRA